jgi:hypothetical protein
MTEIPESVMQIADRVTETILFEHVRFRRTSRRGAPSAIEMDVELVKLSIASALLAAEKRGEERERERIATDLFDRDAFMTACAGDGDPYVKIQFKTLKEMHSFHRTLCDLAAAIRKEPAE